jgi:hypothetical protein
MLLAGSSQAQRAAVANGYSLVDAGGADMAVDLVAGAHEYQERRRIANAAPANTQMLTHVSYADIPREWYYYPYGYSVDGKWKPKCEHQGWAFAS